MKIESDQTVIFEKVVATKDRYGVDAYLTVLDNTGIIGTVQAKLMQLPPSVGKDTLLEILTARELPTAISMPELPASAKAVSPV